MTKTNLTYALDALEDKLQDQPGEARFLASLLQHGHDAFVDVEGIVVEDSMTDDINQIILKSAYNFFDLEEVKPTVASIIKYADALGYKHVFDKKDEKDYLKSLFRLPTEIQDCRVVGGQLRKLHVKRDYINKLRVAIGNVAEISTLEPLSKIISAGQTPIEEYLMKISASNEEGGYLTSDLDIYLANLFDNPNTTIGYKAGFNRYENFIGGSYEPETMHVVIARMKVGKSSWALNVAINLAKQGIHTVIADFEMSKQKWLNRFLSNITGINVRKFKESRFTEEEKDKINDATKIMLKYPIIYTNINGKGIDEALFSVKRLLNKSVPKKNNGHPECMFIYDYIRINDTGDMNNDTKEYQALGFHAIKLKNFAITNKIPILTFVQANRDGINKEDASVASGSDRVGWLCDSLCLFKRKDEEEIAEDKANKRDFNRKLVFLESRDGEESEPGTYVNYKFDGAIARIEEGPSNIELRTAQPLKVSNEDKNTEF
jgi:replicative DNA helicase